MQTRREAMGRLLAGTVGAAAVGSFAGRSVLGANQRIRIGLIGAGGRGKEILKAALKCPDVEAVAAADVYSRRLEEVKAVVPSIKTYSDFRRMLDDKSVDAVLIATPQHTHALQFVPAIQAGKDIYQEKTMAFDAGHARRMRKAFEGSGRIVQVGIQSISGPAVAKVREYLGKDRMGVLTQLHTHHYRNAPYGGWKRAVPADCNPQNVDWDAFQGEAQKRPFDPNRVINWRFFWDYAGSNVYENMVHQVGFWQKVLGLKIPTSVTATGANFLSPDMEVPDTIDVSMRQPENMLFTWNSMFGNEYFGEGHDLLLGNRGTISRDEEERVEYRAQGENAKAGNNAAAAGKAPDIVGGSDATVLHMQNFFDCIRSRKEPNCPFEIGFSAAIACKMSIASYREKRTVTWDEARQDIV